jgi:hypothetical protein
MAKITLELEASVNNLLQGTQDARDGVKSVAQETVKAKTEMEKSFADAGKAGDKVVQSTAKQVNAIKDLKREYNNLISEAVRAGGAQTEAGRKFLAQAGQIKDEIGDIRAATAAYASDTGNLDAAAQGFQVIGDSIQGVAGLQAILGDNTEQYQEILTKLTGIMALNSSAQNLMNNLQAESALVTKANAFAQTAYNIVVGESVGALRLFRLALAATGVGLLIFVIAELALNWDKWKDAITGSNKELEKLNATQKLRADIYKKGAEDAAGEIANVRLLTDAITNEKLPREQRLRALDDYNKIASEGNRITKDQINNSAIVQDQLKKETDLILARATVKAAENELSNKIGEAIKKEVKLRQDLAKAQSAFAFTQTQEFADMNAKMLGGSDVTAEELQRKRQQAEFAVNSLKTQLEKAKDDTQNAGRDILDIINEIQEKFGQAFVISDNTADLMAKRKKEIELAQSILEGVKPMPIDDKTIQQVLKGLMNANVSLDDQIGFLNSLGLNPEAILKALEEARKNLPDAPVKLPVEIINADSVDKSLIKFRGLTIPIKLRLEGLNAEETQQKADAISSSLEQLASSVENTINDAFDTAIEKQKQYIQGLDDQISAQEEAVDAQKQLNDKGLANNLDSEKKRLQGLYQQRQDALKKQKEIAKAQQAVQAAEQAVSLVTASANIIESVSGAGPIGVAIAGVTIAAMFAAFIAAQVKASQLASAGYYKGGFTGIGNPKDEAGVVHREEFVFPAHDTRNYRELFEGIYTKDNKLIQSGLADLLKGTGVTMPNAEMANTLYIIKQEKQEQLDIDNNELKKQLVLVNEKLEGLLSKEVETVTHNSGVTIIKRGNKIKTIKHG